jgi:hypothetical protein
MVAEALETGIVVRLRNKESQEYGEYFVQENNGGFVELIPLETGSVSVVLSHSTINAVYDAVAFAGLEWDEISEEE